MPRRRPHQIRPRPLTEGNPEAFRRIVQEELGKALGALPPGARATPVTQQYLNALQQQRSNVGPGQGQWLPRDTAPSPFGPGIPLLPSALDPLLPSGRPAPRRYQYPVSENLQVTGTRAVPWSVLRDAADKVTIMRMCIEVRKSTIAGLDWSFGIDSTRATRLAQASGASTHTVSTQLREKYADDIDRLHQFWAKPDRINGWTFAEWISAVLEEQLVLDALAIYPHLTMNGDLHSLELIDGSTVKPILDHRGATPQPPYVAYQQILYGFPRGDFTARPTDDPDAQFTALTYGPAPGRAATTDTLIYRVRRRRTNSPYGYSNVEQALSDADLWLKRVDWLRQEYASGVTPEMIVQVTDAYTPETLRAYEAIFNDELSGMTADRHRARFLPAGFNAEFPPGLDEKFSPELDLHLIRLLCANFDVLPTSLGFTPNHGLGGMGHQQGEQDSEGRRATKPTAAFLADLINEISMVWLGMPPEITFSFEGLDDQDEQAEAKLRQGNIAVGLMTLNEGRDDMNMPRYDFPQADEPAVISPTGGLLWVDPQERAANTPAPLGLPPGQHTEPGAEPATPPATPPAAKPAPESPVKEDESVQPVAGEPKKAEQKAFLAWLTKSAGPPARPFVFHHQNTDVAAAANLLAQHGDIDAVTALFDNYG